MLRGVQDSEVIQLFIGVVVGGLNQHLLRLLRQLVLLVQLNAILETLHVPLLGSEIARGNSLLLDFVFCLEISLGLDVAVGASQSDTVCL